MSMLLVGVNCGSIGEANAWGEQWEVQVETLLVFSAEPDYSFIKHVVFPKVNEHAGFEVTTVLDTKQCGDTFMSNVGCECL